LSSAHPAPGAGPASAGGDLAALTALVHRLEENVARVVRGKPEAIRLAFVCLLARGHVLIEDVPGVGKTTLAQALARSLTMKNLDVGERLQRYALNRWQRCARVQARAIRNGEIFHAQGVVRWGRDTALKLLGERLLDVPWLYAGP